MVEYDCKQVILSLVRKWYIILLAMGIAALVSVPIARVSYEQVKSNYAERELNTESHTKYFIKLYYVVETKSENSMHIFVDCMNDSELIQMICEEVGIQYQWEDLASLIEYSYLEDEEILKVSIKYAEEDEVETIESMLTEHLPKYLEDGGFERIILREWLHLDNGQKQDALNEEIFKEPTFMNNSIRIVGTMIVFGFVLGCFIVMLADYKKKSSEQC